VTTLETVRQEAGRFPRRALTGCRDALVLFAAGFHGSNDAIWIAEAGLHAVCVDLDSRKLGEMGGIYPAGWEFVTADAIAYATLTERRFDVVTVDWSTDWFHRADELLPLLCGLARHAVIVGTDKRRVQAPDGWTVAQRLRRSGFNGGVYWTVLRRDTDEPAEHRRPLTPGDVTACLVTRGDVDLQPILDSLIFDDVIVWDNAEEAFDAKCAGRYYAAQEASRPAVYLQDDDVLVPRETQEALLAAYEPGIPAAVYAHGDNPDGYDDLPLVGAGAIMDRDMPWRALERYLEHHELDDGFLYEADFVAGALYPMFKHLHLPFVIDYEVAQHPSRLCNQPFQADLKREMTERARAIRDGMAVAA